MTENNHHSRNLKMISFFFILYWLLDLTPTGDNKITLQFISYEIHNISILPYVSWALLVYFSLRFWLSAKNQLLFDVNKHITKKVNHNINVRFKMKTSPIYNTLKKRAEELYKEEHEEKFKKKASEKTANNHTKIHSKYNWVHSITIKPTLKTSRLKREIPCVASYPNPRVQELSEDSFQLPLKFYEFPFIQTIAFFNFLYTTESSPDYFLPWALCVLAVISAALIHFGIDPHTLFGYDTN